ncbi:DMT family transporter [Rhizobium sp. ZPR3]|uniref:DMT family transporter n=2 Tax=unclassified Rhizobium TaxID=2613769 RepID=A0AAU7SQQ6_9HYPH
MPYPVIPIWELVLCAFLSPLSGAAVRYCNPDLRAIDIVALSLSAPALFVLFYIWKRDRMALKTFRLDVICRSAFCLGSTVATFWCAANIDFASVYFVNMLAPMAATILGWILLSERLSGMQTLTIILAVIGAGVSLSPSFTFSFTGYIALIFAFLCTTGMLFCNRLIGRSTRASTSGALSMCYVAFGSLGLAAPSMAQPHLSDILPLVIIGTTTFAIVILVSHAYSVLTLPLAAPFDFLRIVFSVIIGATAFGAPITGRLLFGLGLILAANLVTIRLAIRSVHAPHRDMAADIRRVQSEAAHK